MGFGAGAVVAGDSSIEDQDEEIRIRFERVSSSTRSLINIQRTTTARTYYILEQINVHI